MKKYIAALLTALLLLCTYHFDVVPIFQNVPKKGGGIFDAYFASGAFLGVVGDRPRHGVLGLRCRGLSADQHS